MRSPLREHRQAITAAVIGTALICAYAFLALAQILWLNPQAAVPGVQLEQIWQDMATANESMSAPFVIGVMGLGPILAIIVLVKAAVRCARSHRPDSREGRAGSDAGYRGQPG